MNPHSSQDYLGATLRTDHPFYSRKRTGAPFDAPAACGERNERAELLFWSLVALPGVAILLWRGLLIALVVLDGLGMEDVVCLAKQATGDDLLRDLTVEVVTEAETRPGCKGLASSGRQVAVGIASALGVNYAATTATHMAGGLLRSARVDAILVALGEAEEAAAVLADNNAAHALILQLDLEALEGRWEFSTLHILSGHYHVYLIIAFLSRRVFFLGRWTSLPQ